MFLASPEIAFSSTSACANFYESIFEAPRKGQMEAFNYELWHDKQKA